MNHIKAFFSSKEKMSMSQPLVKAIWIMAIICVFFAVLMSLLYYRINSSIDIRVISSRRFDLNQLTNNTAMHEATEDILKYASSHPQYTVISEITIEVDNRSSYSYEWKRIESATQGIYVYYPYTISVKNNIWKGKSIWSLLLVSDEETANSLADNKLNCSIELVFCRPLLLLSKKIMLSRCTSGKK